MAVDKLVHSILYSKAFSVGVMLAHCFMTLVLAMLKRGFQARHPDFILVGQVCNMLLLKEGQTTDKMKEICFQHFLLRHIIQKLLRNKL